MRFEINKISNKDKPCKEAKPIILDYIYLSWGIELKTLDDLIKLAEEVKKPLIIYAHNKLSMISIYDDCIE